MNVVQVVDGRVWGEVSAARVLVFDREWVPADRRAAVPAIDVAADAESYAWPLTALAVAAVAAAAGDTVTVIGVGAVAAEARRMLDADARLAAAGAAPSSVIETTGDPDSIRQAMGVVAPMGSVLLAGEVLERRYDLDLYTDAHVRGLRLRGVPTPAGSEPPAASVPVAGGQEIRHGEWLDPAALFYVLLAP